MESAINTRESVLVLTLQGTISHLLTSEREVILSLPQKPERELLKLQALARAVVATVTVLFFFFFKFIIIYLFLCILGINLCACYSRCC